MALIRTFEGKSPSIDKEAFLAENAVVTGEVTIAGGASVWYHAVIRGDVLPITIGENTNVQDHSMIHTSHGRKPVSIGKNVTIGHRAIVHGCSIDDNALIGMGAILLDDAFIGKGAIIAAGAVVLEGTQVEPGALYAGVPAKKVREDDPEKRSEALKAHAQTYVDTAREYRKVNRSDKNLGPGIF